MRRLVAATVLLLAAVGDAVADVKREVQVESDPPGADVYLSSKDDGSVCKTPCTIKAPVGDAIVIIELENHLPLVESISVPRRGKPPTARFKLVRALGTLNVKGPEGATIRVGDVDKGKAPAKLEVDAGPQTITLILNGKQVLQDLIVVEANEEVVVRGKDVAAGTPAPDPDVIDVGDSDPGGGTGVTTTAKPPRAPRGKLVALSGLFDVGFRKFRYENVNTTDTLRPENEVGQVIAGPLIEVWPGTIAGIHALRGLALIGRFQFPVNRQPVTGGGLMGATTTFWQSLEISLRHRWTIGSTGTAEVGAGYVRDQHQFNTNVQTDLRLVPDADYRSIRIGVRGSLLIGALEPYLGLENRIVMSGGKVIEDRFSLGASATGLRGALGVGAHLGPFAASLEASITRYAWTFKYDTMDEFKADGASDSIFMISAALGYAY
ncbi:MAG TPA: PEGA domain-containing protein [Kofleriaceae bacterium]|nr:PEGA domain-containing protein [Kofleriaceae bacterium]